MITFAAMKKLKAIEYIHRWRLKHISQRQFILMLSFVIGILSGLAAVILKNLVHYTGEILTGSFEITQSNFLYLLYPLIGIGLSALFVKLFIKDDISHGISKILYCISRRNGFIKPHNNYSSMIASTFTVGFGGSVGLEAPVVLTGASIGSNLGRIFHLSFKNIMLMIGCGAAGAIAAIFKAPFAALIFALEVLMLDLTMASLIPLLISSVTAAVLAFFLMGKSVLFSFTITDPFILKNIPFYILLGILCGMVSLYFTRMSMAVEFWLSKRKSPVIRWLVGGLTLSFLIFLFPPLYGEGYETLSAILNGHGDKLVFNSLFFSISDISGIFLLFLLLVILLKAIASATTTGSGGVGGVFAPSLFIGGVTGFFLSRIMSLLNLAHLPESNFALAGMAGVMAAIMHAPLTAIFLIAEITGGYSFFIPLIITATIAYLTIRSFEHHSIYTKRLAAKGELLTHHKDKALLSLMRIDPLIERNFSEVPLEATLGEFVKIVSTSKRNVFPVLDDERHFHGLIFINDIREIIFKPELYNKIEIRNLMYMPDVVLDINSTMEEVAQQFHESEHYNLPVLANGTYVGFVSRANMFSKYREMLRDFSEE